MLYALIKEITNKHKLISTKHSNVSNNIFSNLHWVHIQHSIVYCYRVLHVLWRILIPFSVIPVIILIGHIFFHIFLRFLLRMLSLSSLIRVAPITISGFIVDKIYILYSI